MAPLPHEVWGERGLELPAEWGGIVPTEVFVDEGKRLAENASSKGIPLRLLGGVAIRIHCSEFMDFAKKLVRLGEGQQEYTDLDYMSAVKFRSRMKDFFASAGYDRRPTTMSMAATQRQVYFHPKGWFYVDVFFDKLLAANHPLDFRSRLDLDFPTISPADLLLEKLQIVFPGEKDVKDTMLLLRAHQVAHGEEKNKIDSEYIAKLLSNEWGFWYTATTNLNGLKDYTKSFENLNDEEKTDIATKIDSLLDAIEKEPKSTGWKMRSVVGTKKSWYNAVETTQTVGEFGIWKLREQKKPDQPK